MANSTIGESDRCCGEEVAAEDSQRADQQDRPSAQIRQDEAEDRTCRETCDAAPPYLVRREQFTLDREAWAVGLGREQIERVDAALPVIVIIAQIGAGLQDHCAENRPNEARQRKVTVVYRASHACERGAAGRQKRPRARRPEPCGKRTRLHRSSVREYRCANHNILNLKWRAS